MQHGRYIAEFEKELASRGMAISWHSLADLIRQVDFSRLAAEKPAARKELYSAFADKISDTPRGRLADGTQVLGEGDAFAIVEGMKDAANKRSLSGSLRDIWCRIFIGGCP